MAGDRRLATRIPAGLTRTAGRRFAFTVGGAFLGLAGLAWWRDHVRAAVVLAVVGGVLVLGGLALPGHLGPVYRAWMGLGRAISKVTSPIFLGLVYFLVFTPFGLIMRLTGRRTLVPSATGVSWWISRGSQRRQRKDMERQF